MLLLLLLLILLLLLLLTIIIITTIIIINYFLHSYSWDFYSLYLHWRPGFKDFLSGLYTISISPDAYTNNNAYNIEFTISSIRIFNETFIIFIVKFWLFIWTRLKLSHLKGSREKQRLNVKKILVVARELNPGPLALATSALATTHDFQNLHNFTFILLSIIFVFWLFHWPHWSIL